MFPDSTSLPWVPNGLTTLPVITKVTEKAKLVEKGMLPKGLPMTSAKNVAVAVPCLPRISETPTRKSAELSAVFEEAKA